MIKPGSSLRRNPIPEGGIMHRKTILMALAGCLLLMLAMSSLSFAAPPQDKVANLKFSGALSKSDRDYLGLDKPGAFTLQDIKAPYILIEITRST
jgi:hypothetical protein